jgi:hypothetical protein
MVCSGVVVVIGFACVVCVGFAFGLFAFGF